MRFLWKLRPLDRSSVHHCLETLLWSGDLNFTGKYKFKAKIPMRKRVDPLYIRTFTAVTLFLLVCWLVRSNVRHQLANVNQC